MAERTRPARESNWAQVLGIAPGPSLQDGLSPSKALTDGKRRAVQIVTGRRDTG